MASNIQTAAGTDLDSIFKPGSGGGATNFQTVDGNDISIRYAPYVSGAQASATNLQLVNGSDLNTRFAPIGGTPLTASAAPASVTGSTNTAGATVTTPSSTATGSGGSGSYSSYSWVFQSGNNTIVASNPSAQTTTFRKTNVGTNFSDTAIYYCTVTDSAGTTANTGQVAATINGKQV